MTTLEGAWEAFLAAVADAQQLHAAGVGTEIRHVTTLSTAQYNPVTALAAARAIIAPMLLLMS